MRGFFSQPVPWLWIAVLACIYGGWQAWSTREIVRTPGILAPDNPQQAALDADAASFDYRGFEIHPLAQFALTARVLHRENYYFDRLSRLVPTDLALGWGRMSDSAVLSTIGIEQGDRFFFWHTAAFVIPRREIETHSANMHLIPATAAVAHRLKQVRAGNLITLSGELVEAHSAGGWSIRSSLTRDDTGAGACELVWVESLDLQ